MEGVVGFVDEGAAVVCADTVDAASTHIADVTARRAGEYIVRDGYSQRR